MRGLHAHNTPRLSTSGKDGKDGEGRQGGKGSKGGKGQGAGPISKMLQELGSSTGRAQTAALLDDLVEHGVHLKPRSVATMIVTLGRRKMLAEAIEHHRRMPEPTVDTFSALITACGNSGELDKALGFHAEMRNAQVQPNYATYDALMELFDRCGRPDGIEHAFARAVGQGMFEAAVTSRKRGTGAARHAIDLHGCTRLGALAAIRHKLDRPTDRDLAMGLGIITGKGIGSAGDPAVPPAVMELLKSEQYAGLEARVDPANHGCIVIGAARLATWHAARRSSV